MQTATPSRNALARKWRRSGRRSRGSRPLGKAGGLGRGRDPLALFEERGRDLTRSAAGMPAVKTDAPAAGSPAPPAPPVIAPPHPLGRLACRCRLADRCTVGRHGRGRGSRKEADCSRHGRSEQNRSQCHSILRGRNATAPRDRAHHVIRPAPSSSGAVNGELANSPDTKDRKQDDARTRKHLRAI
jgi:hypothetical protein